MKGLKSDTNNVQSNSGVALGIYSKSILVKKLIKLALIHGKFECRICGCEVADNRDDIVGNDMVESRSSPEAAAIVWWCWLSMEGNPQNLVNNRTPKMISVLL